MSYFMREKISKQYSGPESGTVVMETQLKI